VIRTELYKRRRRAHPRHFTQHIEPWQDRRSKYLEAKNYPEQAL
jgi:hypothetical protein